MKKKRLTLTEIREQNAFLRSLLRSFKDIREGRVSEFQKQF